MAVTLGTFDTTSHGAGFGTSITVPWTVDAGDDRLLVVGVSLRIGGVSGVTYDGVALTQAASPSGQVSLWVLAAPPVGTADIVLSGTFGFSGYVFRANVTGVDPTAPIGATETGSGTVPPQPSTALLSAADGLVLDLVAVDVAGSTANTITVGAGQTERANVPMYNTPSDTSTTTGVSTAPGTGSAVTMSWGISPAYSSWLQAAIAIAPVPSAPPLVLTPDTGTATLAGSSASMTGGATLIPDTGAATLAGQPATLTGGMTLSPGTGTLTMAANDTVLTFGQVWQAVNAGAMTVAGRDILTTPTLLLSPDGSRDRTGPVTPTITGDVQVVPGQYGSAWHVELGSTDTVVTFLDTDVLVGRTVLFRARVNAYDSGSKGLITLGNWNEAGQDAVAIRLIGTFLNVAVRHSNIGELHVNHAQRIGEWFTFAWRWDQGVTTSGYADTFPVTTVPFPTTGHMAPRVGLFAFSRSPDVDMESPLLFDTALPDAEIARISQMPTAWTWANVQGGGLTGGAVLTPDTATMDLTGLTAALGVGITLHPGTATMTIGAPDATMTGGARLVPDAAVLTMAGSAAEWIVVKLPIGGIMRTVLVDPLVLDRVDGADVIELARLAAETPASVLRTVGGEPLVILKTEGRD